MYIPWKKQIVAHPHTRDLCGTIAFQSVAISLHKWCQKFASLQISWVTRQTIAYGLLALLNYMKQRCQKKIIQERTGHHSLECLRTYERTSDKQHQAVSNILSSTSQSSYHALIAKLDPSNHQLSTQTTPTPGQLSNMSFAKCQVNININHGPSAPVMFTTTTSPVSRSSTSDMGMPSEDELLQFLR